MVRVTPVNSSMGEGGRAYTKVVSICIFCLIFTTQTNVSTSEVCSLPWEMGPRAFNSMILMSYTPFLAPIT